MSWRHALEGKARRANDLRRRLGLHKPTSSAVTFFGGLGPALPDTDVDQRRQDGRRQNVLVLATPSADDLGPVLDSLGPARVRVFAPKVSPDWQLARRGITQVRAQGAGRIGWHAKRFGPYDAIISMLPSGEAEPFELFRRLFLHLRAGGRYIVDRRLLDEAAWTELITALHQLGPYRVGDDDHTHSELSRAIASIQLDRQSLVVVKRNDHWLKLRNEQTDRFLPTRDVPASSRLIASQRAGSFSSRASVQLHVYEEEPQDFPDAFDYPELYLHEYTGELTMATHSVLYTDHTVLPETFRYQQVPVLTNSSLIESDTQWDERRPPAWSSSLARVPDTLRAERTLEGSYYHLDSPYPGHFGHLMTEVVSRLWGWDQAKTENRELKALLGVRRGDRLPHLEQSIFRAFGIGADDIVWTPEPVRVRSIVGVTPMWQNSRPHYVHPDIQHTWRRLGDGLIRPGVRTPEKIFVSRRDRRNRPCRNSAEVDAYFAEHGYQVIFPETMDLTEQATVFAGAKVVAGFGGSALFNMMFCRRLEKLIILTHESYTARNEYLYASVLGCQTHYVWSNPDIRHPQGDWTTEAFRSPWAFDFDRNKPVLDGIVD